MRRVAVIGSGGAGKTTFSNRLAESTGLRAYHLDEYHWRPGWIEPPDDEWQRVQRELAALDEWIMDGNYSRTLDIRLERADTVILLAPSRLVCTLRVLKRVVTTWHEPTQAPGCPEHFDAVFLRWVWRYPRDARPHVDAALAAFRGRFELIELTTPRAARHYLDAVTSGQ